MLHDPMKQLLLFIFLSCFSFIAQARTQCVAQYGAWKVYRVVQKKKALYYAISHPYKTTGRLKRRKKPYIMISRTASGKSIQSMVYTGTPHKDFSKLKVCPGRSCHTVYTKDNRAWSGNQKTEQKILKDMKAYKFLQVKFTHKGCTIKDHYSLKGFQKAYQRVLRGGEKR